MATRKSSSRTSTSPDRAKSKSANKSKSASKSKSSSKVKTPSPQATTSAAQRIDARIGEYDDWRGATLARLRALVNEADPEIVEEWKWDVPVWSRDGLVSTGEVYKNVVKMTFAKGASLKDPAGLFNSSLTGNTRRAIDFHEGEKIDEEALKALIREAVKLNTSGKR